MFSNEDYLAGLLVEAGAVSPEKLEQARRTGGSVIEKLLSETDLSDETVCAVLAQNAGIEAIDLGAMVIPPDVASAIPDEIARRYRVIPVADDGVFLSVAVADPFDFEALDSLPHVLGRELNFFCAPAGAMSLYLKQFYGATDSPGGMDIRAADVKRRR